MKRLFQKKQNNAGSTLVMVIVCMLFVGIIASLVLTLTLGNLDEAQMTSRSTDNFYSTENVVDELKSILDEEASKSVELAYMNWLSHYQDSATFADRRQEFIDDFTEDFVARLNRKFSNAHDDAVPGISDIGNQLFINFDPSSILFPAGDVTAVPETDPSTGKNTGVRIKDIKITYTDETGFTSTITTDIIYKVKYPGFAINTSTGQNLECSNFSLIADCQVTNGVQDMESAKIKGSIYGGGYNALRDDYNDPGIMFFGERTKPEIFAKKLITRTSIRLQNKADVTVKGYSADLGHEDTCEVWAKNIELGIDTQTDPVNLEVMGICNIADDLTLQSNYSRFKLLGDNISEYYGYSMSNSTSLLRNGTADGSSAVVINGKNAGLDMSNARKIWIAGKTYVAVPHSSEDFLQGESISFRGLQSAYLLPGSCIKGIGHNPLTEADFNHLINNEEGYGIDIYASEKNGGVKLENYIQSDIVNPDGTVSYNSFKSTVVQYPSGDNLRYLYLNFQSADKAAEYFREYENMYSDMIDDKLESQFESGDILINTSVLESTGNVITYNGSDTAGSKYKGLYEASLSSGDKTVLSAKIDRESTFSGLVTSLNPNYVGDITHGRLTDALVEFDAYASDFEGYNVKVISDPNVMRGSSSVNAYLITGDNISIDGSEAEDFASNVAIIIADGDVYLRNGVTFNGMVIARGSIYVEGNIRVNSDADNISYLIRNNDEVKKYFKISGEAGVGGLEGPESGSPAAEGAAVYVSDILQFEYDNWKKN